MQIGRRIVPIGHGRESQRWRREKSGISEQGTGDLWTNVEKIYQEEKKLQQTFEYRQKAFGVRQTICNMLASPCLATI